NLHLALIQVPATMFASAWPELVKDQGQVLCLRSVLMKPGHEAWLPEILARLGKATEKSVTGNLSSGT
ncbi:MAG TPA: hypothetical protein VNH18_08610, partial [Bryobacteraceae bacterium]|nr:hypothetical protein [Bryobacteraceae bacterium]